MACSGCATMIVMKPGRQLVERARGWRGWLIPAALFALVPKCVLCLLAYTGLGAVLRLGGPELCGGAAASTLPWPLLLPLLGGTLGVALKRRV